MNKRKDEFDVEYEYKTRRLSGEQMEMNVFLDSHCLDKIEKRQLMRRLQKWEMSMSGFEEYYESVDSEAMFQKILGRIGLSMQLVPQHLNMADVPSWSEAVRKTVRQWLKKLHQNSMKQAVGSVVEAGTLGSISVEVLDEHSGEREEVEFQLRTEIEVSQNGELVFSAVAPDPRYNGELVHIKVQDEGRDLLLCSTVVDDNGHIEVFLDLSCLGEGIQVNQHMIKVQLVRSESK